MYCVCVCVHACMRLVPALPRARRDVLCNNGSVYMYMQMDSTYTILCKIIFSVLSETSSWVPVMPVGGNNIIALYMNINMYYGGWMEHQGRYRKTALTGALQGAIHYVHVAGTPFGDRYYSLGQHDKCTLLPQSPIHSTPTNGPNRLIYRIKILHIPGK